MKKDARTWISLLLLLMIVGTVRANDDVLTFTPPTEAIAIPSGGTATVEIKAQLHDPWHINAHEPTEEFLIPTVVEFDDHPSIVVGSVTYPKAKEVTLSFSETPLLVYEKEITFTVPVQVQAGTPEGDLELAGSFTYQACNNMSCIAPKTLDFVVPVQVAGVAEGAAALDSGASTGTTAVAPEGGATGGGEAKLSDYLSADASLGNIVERYGTLGYVMVFALVFVGGLALNLTPCVLPVVPITIGFFTNQAKTRQGSLFFLTLSYVAGVAITFSVLGTLAAVSGGLWGQAMQSPAVLVGVALVLIALSLSMFGFYDIQVPTAISSRVGAKQGPMGALFMGAVVGIVAAPCVGPFILGLMLFVSSTGSIALGSGLFFTMGVGFGMPYLILGLSSGALNKLPQAGAWMDVVKHIFGMIILGMAFYFVQPLIPDNLYRIVFSAYICACGAYLLLGKGDKYTTKGIAVGMRGLGLATIGLGIWFMIPSNAESMEFRAFSRPAFEEALASGKPIMVDATAEWCIPCRELEHYTFTDAKVIADGQRFHRFKLDLTASNDANDALRREFNIGGVPTILFYDSSGTERADLRVNQFVRADEFLRRMQQVQ